MSRSNFTILKQCENCRGLFQAQKRTTRFCSHRCASQNYKLRKQLEAKEGAEVKTIEPQRLAPKVQALHLEVVRQKDFLSVKEVSLLFSCSKGTVYRMIRAGEIKAVNLLSRLTRIRRKDVERLFDVPMTPKA